MSPARELLPAAIARAAAARPERIAIDAGANSLTYAALCARSQSCAHVLREHGVGRGDLVAVAATRTPDLIPALLGILQCGAAYLPLDPAYPPERLDYMLADSGAAVLLTEPGCAERFRLARHVPTVLLQHACEWHVDGRIAEGSSAGATAVRAVTAPEFTEDDLAYVIYTSGSTGRPKGVEVTHRGLANFVRSMQREPGVGSDDRVLAHTTLSFDIAALELWVPLAAGGCVVLIDDTAARDPRALVDALATRGVTIAQATPTMWALMLEAHAASPRPLPAALKVLVGGEPLPPALAAALCRHAPEVWNMYGPTETTVWSSVWRLRPDAPIQIGHPIDDTTIHVVDADGQIVPDGDIGELWIGGAGVARGYRGRPELTCERFVPDRFSGDPDARLYRTGDLGRCVAGGFECLGRIDTQLKVAGHRIEPAEIEAAIGSHRAVQQVGVTSVPTAAGEPHLVACVVARGAAPSVRELRDHAAASLPPHMVPVDWVMADSLPQLPNGKLDRAALPALAGGRQRLTVAYVPPRTNTERVLCDMWRDVLGVDRVGITDDFFELGGRSRLAARLFARIAAELGRPLPLATLFEASTVAALAAIVERNDAATSPAIVALHEASAPAILPFFCMYPVGGHVMSYRPLAHALAGVPFYGIQAAGLNPGVAPHTTVEAMAEYAIAAVKSVQPTGPYSLGGASFGGLIAFEAARRLRAAGESVRTVVLLDTELPRDVTRAWPVPRFVRSALALARSVRTRWQHTRVDAVTGTLAAVIDANYQAMAAYVPGLYPGDVVYFKAADARPPLDTRDQWRRFAAHLEIVDVPGDHYTMRTEPHVHTLAAALRPFLCDAQPRVAPRSAA